MSFLIVHVLYFQSSDFNNQPPHSLCCLGHTIYVTKVPTPSSFPGKLCSSSWYQGLWELVNPHLTWCAELIEKWYRYWHWVLKMRSCSPALPTPVPPAVSSHLGWGDTHSSRWRTGAHQTSPSQDLRAAPSLLGNSEFLSGHSVYLAFALHVLSFIYSPFDIPGLTAESREALHLPNAIH